MYQEFEALSKLLHPGTDHQDEQVGVMSFLILLLAQALHFCRTRMAGNRLGLQHLVLLAEGLMCRLLHQGVSRMRQH